MERRLGQLVESEWMFSVLISHNINFHSDLYALQRFQNINYTVYESMKSIIMHMAVLLNHSCGSLNHFCDLLHYLCIIISWLFYSAEFALQWMFNLDRFVNTVPAKVGSNVIERIAASRKQRLVYENVLATCLLNTSILVFCFMVPPVHYGTCSGI